MPFTGLVRRRPLAWVALAASALTLAALAVAPAAAGRRERGKQARVTSDADKPGNLAVIDANVFEIANETGMRRILVRALVENQTPVDAEAGFRLEVGKRRQRAPLGACQTELMPRGRVALCEIWIAGSEVDEGEVLEVALDRSFGGLDAWDRDPSDDSRRVALQTIPEGGAVLRIATWDVQPRILAGMGEVQFRFIVEGAHLVWLLDTDPDSKPRLLAGHPADGILDGKGRLKIRDSGPVTLVARNSLGAFVYETIPVQNTYKPPSVAWIRTPAQESDGVATAVVLEAGQYDSDADAAVLSGLRTYLAAKDWALEIQKMRERDAEAEKPRPASVLNPGR